MKKTTEKILARQPYQTSMDRPPVDIDLSEIKKFDLFDAIKQKTVKCGEFIKSKSEELSNVAKVGVVTGVLVFSAFLPNYSLNFDNDSIKLNNKNSAEAASIIDGNSILSDLVRSAVNSATWEAQSAISKGIRDTVQGTGQKTQPQQQSQGGWRDDGKGGRVMDYQEYIKMKQGSGSLENSKVQVVLNKFGNWEQAQSRQQLFDMAKMLVADAKIIHENAEKGYKENPNSIKALTMYREATWLYESSLAFYMPQNLKDPQLVSIDAVKSLKSWVSSKTNNKGFGIESMEREKFLNAYFDFKVSQLKSQQVVSTNITPKL